MIDDFSMALALYHRLDLIAGHRLLVTQKLQKFSNKNLDICSRLFIHAKAHLKGLAKGKKSKKNRARLCGTKGFSFGGSVVLWFWVPGVLGFS